MTVREKLDFSVRCQGVGSRAEIMIEVSRREKQSGIGPNPNVDIYMKILGLDICAYTLIGDAMRRGEVIVDPTKSLFMDEISNGLDSSTTYQIVACLQQLAHITDATILETETFDLFDDIIFMAEGKIVYHGPCSHVLEFFEDCGFRCSERKGVADFLQEVISKKDQAQYWHQTKQSCNYISTDMFSKKFKESPFGKKLDEELSKPFSKPHSHKNAISLASILFLNRHSFEPACKGTSSHEEEFFCLCVQINSACYHCTFNYYSLQLVIIASVAMTVFLQTRMNVDAIHANYYLGALFYALIILFFDGFPELSLTVRRLAVFYKQRDLYFYPAWAYAIPATILKVPISLSSALIWTSLTYYVIGYSLEAGRLLHLCFVLWHLSSAPRLLLQQLAVRESAFTQKKLQLLCDITGAFRPGVLTALMGVSGTTLMDVLAGRKTSGTIEGDIRIGGFPKVQETFARISGYSEQTDIHSPQITVEESVVYSSWLRLHPEIDSKTKFEFVKEVLEIIEFDEIKDCLVGMPSVSGLSTEQRKRLTIDMELVANPSIIFMDEPTTGLDNGAEAGRTIVCTIHQPSIDIFEAFDELILLKAGRQVIYSGPLGQHSSTVIEYFEAISGVQKIRNNYNPATWMLEITSRSAEAQLCVDFAQSAFYTMLSLFSGYLIPQLSSMDENHCVRPEETYMLQEKLRKSPSQNGSSILFVPNPNLSSH
ncbi:Pleiotropic drug resistance protein 3 [Camellia lanceoleosa]|uniref:Pleiotropic drug resistance protein 3 n=1 Tax=Camellia lanceoleosa TaxID=1840588 RepID=A0ACC0ILF4_9ERIC|nr:Pleiotropic drug resistance protein 3 [Camellia lanceoleosa]